MIFTHPPQFDGCCEEIDLVIAYDYEPAEPEVLYPVEDAYPGCAENAEISEIQFNIGGLLSSVTDVIDQDFKDSLVEYCLMDFRSRNDEY